MPTFEAPPTHWRGLQVPFVAQWESELLTDVAWEPRISALALVPLVTVPGGRPRFGNMSMLRQRACLLEKRCQVCGRELGAWKWSAAFGRELDRTRSLVTGVDAILRSEPMMHLKCAALSARVCPGIRKRRPSFQAVVAWTRLVQTVVVDVEEEAWRGPASRGPYAGFIEYVVTELRTWHPYETFLEMTEGEVDRAEVEAWRAAAL